MSALIAPPVTIQFSLSDDPRTRLPDWLAIGTKTCAKQASSTLLSHLDQAGGCSWSAPTIRGIRIRAIWRMPQRRPSSLLIIEEQLPASTRRPNWWCVMLPGTTFQTRSLATMVIAPVESHWKHKPRAFACRSSNHSSLLDLCACVIREGKLERHERWLQKITW